MVIGALILVFAVWGAYGIVDLSLGPPNYAAKANGEKISLKEAQEAWQRQQVLWQRQFGGELPPEMKSRMQDQMLEGMVSDALLHAHANKLGYRISEQSVHDQVRQVPQFQIDANTRRMPRVSRSSPPACRSRSSSCLCAVISSAGSWRKPSRSPTS